MDLKVKRLSAKAVLPKIAKKGDAGMDLTASRVDRVEEFGKGVKYIVHSDIAVEIPSGYVGLIFPRSSISHRGVFLVNSVGVIDSGYRGEITAHFRECAMRAEPYEVGERFCQLVLQKIPEVEVQEVEDLSESERGAGGYGSSGK